MKPTCINCRFSDFGSHLSELGECRRFAPRATIGQLDPDARYGRPELAGWPSVRPAEGCGEFEASTAAYDALSTIVREKIFGDGTDASDQRVIDLCRSARDRFGIERQS